jgi:uncharacterized protein Usg
VFTQARRTVVLKLWTTDLQTVLHSRGVYTRIKAISYQAVKTIDGMMSHP